MESAVVGYDLASVKNQQLSSYPRCDYLLQVAVEKARLGLGYVCSCQEMQLAGSLRNGFRDFSLKNRGFEIFALKFGIFEILSCSIC